MHGTMKAGVTKEDGKNTVLADSCGMLIWRKVVPGDRIGPNTVCAASKVSTSLKYLARKSGWLGRL